MSERSNEIVAFIKDLLNINNVYFQPPTTIQINYPACIIEINDLETNFANNAGYILNTAYKLTLIDKRPDSEMKYKLASQPFCSFNTRYTADNLYHDVFTLYH